MWLEKFTHLTVRLKTASDSKSTVWQRIQTLTTRFIKKIMTNTRKTCALFNKFRLYLLSHFTLLA